MKIRAGPGNERRSGRARRRRADGRAARRSYWPQESADYVDPVFGGFSLLTAFASSLNQLTLLRFLTGLGLGAAMPNAATLMSEYAPERRRALMVNLMFVGFPMGSSLGGFLSAG